MTEALEGLTILKQPMLMLGGAIAGFGLKGGLPSADSGRYLPEEKRSNDNAAKPLHNLLRSSMRILLKRTTSQRGPFSPQVLAPRVLHFYGVGKDAVWI